MKKPINYFLFFALTASTTFSGEIEDFFVDVVSKSKATVKQTKELTLGISKDLVNFPREYLIELESEERRAKERLENGQMVLEYRLHNLNNPFWSAQEDLFFEGDQERLEELGEDYAKGALDETVDNLPTIGSIVHTIKGFFKRRFQLRVEPSKEADYNELPPQAKQELRRRKLEEKDAVTIKTRDARDFMDKYLGEASEFSTGFEMDSTSEIGYFFRLEDFTLAKKDFVSFRTGYVLGKDESSLKASLEKSLKNRRFLTLYGEQDFKENENAVGLTFQKGYENGRAISLNLETALKKDNGQRKQDTRIFFTYKRRF